MAEAGWAAARAGRRAETGGFLGTAASSQLAVENCRVAGANCQAAATDCRADAGSFRAPGKDSVAVGANCRVTVAGWPAA